MAAPVLAQDLEDAWVPDRGPAAVVKPSGMRRRRYAGGADEEDLRVLPNLPDASIAVDARSLQREVYKQLYKQDLKEEQPNDAEE